MYIVTYIGALVFYSWNLMYLEHSPHGSLAQKSELSTPKNVSTGAMTNRVPVQNSSSIDGSFVEP